MTTNSCLDAIEMFIYAGMDPAGEHEVDWIRGRYNAVVDLDDGYIVGTVTDPEASVTIAVLDKFGNTRTEIGFGVDDLSAVALATTVAAITQKAEQ